MIVRRWCCKWMERRAPLVVATGVLGMAGFVGAFVAVAMGWLGGSGYLGAVALSLAAYSTSLAIGHLGDPFVLRRNLERASLASQERQPRQIPRSSWTWPVRWKPNLSATSR